MLSRCPSALRLGSRAAVLHSRESVLHPSKPTIGQVKSIVSGVPHPDILTDLLQTETKH
jgi:hypothetical protein